MSPDVTNALPYAAVPLDLLCSHSLKPNEIRLIAFLLNLGSRSGKCFPSMEYIARKLFGDEKKRTTVAGIISKLVKDGFLTKTNRTRPDGGTTSNEYTVVVCPAAWRCEYRAEAIALLSDKAAETVTQFSSQTEVHKKDVPTVEEPVKATEPVKVIALPVPDADSAPSIFDAPEERSVRPKKRKVRKERISMDTVKSVLGYRRVLLNASEDDENDALVEAVYEVIYHVLNSSAESINICGEPVPTADVRARLMELTPELILRAIDKFRASGSLIKNRTGWFVSTLYNEKKEKSLEAGTNWQAVYKNRGVKPKYGSSTFHTYIQSDTDYDAAAAAEQEKYFKELFSDRA